MVLQTHIGRDDLASQLSSSTATISAAAYSALVSHAATRIRLNGSSR